MKLLNVLLLLVKLLTILLPILLQGFLSTKVTAAYVGSKECQACHVEEYLQWQQSDHFRAMEDATLASILGDFDNKELNYHGVTYLLSKDDKKAYLSIRNDSGSLETYPILYTFGFYPLQQYLVELENGHIQALNIAWDSRTKEEGGQRWFHLREDEAIDADNIFYWQRHFQNWNSRCGECHTTGFRKNYDAESRRYQSQWAENNVACEACHGPGDKHLKLIKEGRFDIPGVGFSVTKMATTDWRFDPKSATATETEINIESTPAANAIAPFAMCAGCHSARNKLAEAKPGNDFSQQFHLSFIKPPNYFTDGQIREEVFVLGSFLQSKMHKRGVTCLNCHDAHSNQLKISGNNLCAQCHASDVFSSKQHHRHAPASAGAQCVNCHMPERVYMGVDARRDHSFIVPGKSDLTEREAPSPCLGCHQSSGQDWVTSQLERWGVTDKNHWSELHSRLLVGRADAEAELWTLIQNADDSHSTIVLSSLITALDRYPPSDVAIEIINFALKHADPLMRRSGVIATNNYPAQLRWNLLSPFINDNTLGVRVAVASALADIKPQLPASHPYTSELTGLLDEYRKSLQINEDSPISLVALGDLEMKLREPTKAVEFYQSALQIEANYLPAYIALSQAYRQLGDHKNVEDTLLAALAIEPNNPLLHHSLGLSLVRSKQYAKAMPYLKTAALAETAMPRYVYVYAVALHNQNQVDVSLDILKGGIVRFKGDSRESLSLVLLLVGYLEKLGRIEEILPYIGVLEKSEFKTPQTQRLILKYGRQGSLN